MASGLYDKGRESFLKGEISWNTDDIKIALIDTGDYTVNLATHQFHSDLSGIIATSSNLTSKTTNAGVADAADVVLSLVSGVTAEALVIYQDSGVSSTSRLIAYIDSATGLPVTPNGSDLTIAWDNGSSKIFKL
jgi:hypothetical protein